jgi:transposase
MAEALGISKSTVQRVWAQARLKPHRLDSFMASDDPRIEEKAADIIGLYMNPPQHGAVFCVDEKTAIQALDRLDPVLPLSPGRAERHGFEYYRHGTLSLYAALDVNTGKVQGMTAARHTSQDFVAFLEGLVERTAWAQQIHVVLDNLSAHKTKDVGRFLREHPRVRFHFTPTYSSWLNQVELWFAKIQRDVIARGVFTSVADLGKKLNSARPGCASPAQVGHQTQSLTIFVDDVDAHFERAKSAGVKRICTRPSMTNGSTEPKTLKVITGSFRGTLGM